MKDCTKNLWDVFIAGAQLFFVIAGLIWAFFRFRREGVHRRRIEFSIECKSLGPQEGDYLAEFRLHAMNRGIVAHRVPSINLRVRGIAAGERLQEWEGHEPRLFFPTKIINAEVLHRPKYDYIFVEPGVEQVITYVVKIPQTMRFKAARAEFQYDNGDPHSAERVFEVAPQLAE